MWLIIPLIYFLGWWQTRSLRQAFNGTVAWIVGYAIFAGGILLLDIGGFDGVSATPDSPAAGIAILGGFIGMWISNIIWRRRGGDPERTPGKWERAARAMVSGDKKSSKKKRPASAAQQVPQPRQAQPQQPPPVDAQYRPAQNQPQPARQYQAAQATAPSQQGPVQQRPSPQQEQRRSETADKYAKATGRALGAMFRSSSSSSKKKKTRNKRLQQ